jgi:hypothetical protein
MGVGLQLRSLGKMGDNWDAGSVPPPFARIPLNYRRIFFILLGKVGLMLIGLQIGNASGPLEGEGIFELDDYGDFKLQGKVLDQDGQYLELFDFALLRPFQMGIWQGIPAFRVKVTMTIKSLDGQMEPQVHKDQEAWMICENPEDVEMAEVYIQEEVMYKT